MVNRLCSSRWNYRRCQSPHKGCSLALASKLIIRERTQALTEVGWFRACNKQHPHSGALCFPSLILTWYLPSSFQPWPTAGKYHSKLFPTKPLSVSLPAGAWVMSNVGSDPIEVHIPSVGWKHWGYGWPGDSNPGPLRWKLSALPLLAIQTTKRAGHGWDKGHKKGLVHRWWKYWPYRESGLAKRCAIKF